MINFKKEYNKEKEKFYLMTNEWFERGIMREVYCGDSFCICSVLNKFYAFFDFGMIKDLGFIKKQDLVLTGTMFGIQDLDNFIKNPMSYYEGIHNGTLLGKFIKYSFKINDENLKRFLVLKEKYAGNPPNSYIDFEWEAKINNINKEEKRVNL